MAANLAVNLAVNLAAFAAACLSFPMAGCDDVILFDFAAIKKTTSRDYKVAYVIVDFFPSTDFYCHGGLSVCCGSTLVDQLKPFSHGIENVEIHPVCFNRDLVI